MEVISLANYSIYIGEIWPAIKQFIKQGKYSSLICLVDENTKRDCLPIFQNALEDYNFNVIEIKSGEEQKHVETCKSIWSDMKSFSADRKSLVINLGGGVIGDMGGFCAATYMRGIDFIQVPTTLLSQVDSSIGGKLGIDFEAYKNFIGLFKDPKAVFIHNGFLNTLPERELRSGFAEIMKHALIADPELWRLISKIDKIEIEKVDPLIIKALMIKKQIVEKDPFENGMRKILNFGHSIGHAIESNSMKDGDRLLHGESIAIGMICESFISRELLKLSEQELNKIIERFTHFFGKVDLSRFSTDAILDYLKLDKKNVGNTLNFSLIKSIGSASYNENVNVSLIMDSLHSYSNL